MRPEIASQGNGIPLADFAEFSKVKATPAGMRWRRFAAFPVQLTLVLVPGQDRLSADACALLGPVLSGFQGVSVDYSVTWVLR
jgi:hypothetical protein